MKRLFFASALAVILSACGNQQPQQPEYHPQQEISNEEIDFIPEEVGSITFATMAALDSFPIFLAYEMGFFDDEGLEVNLMPFFSAPDRDAAFQTTPGIDGLVFDLVALSMYQQGGIDVVAVSSSIGLTSILGGQDVYYLQDLDDRSVLISLNTAMDYILARALESVELTQENVETLLVPPLPVRLEMLVAGQADAAVLPEPFATMAIEEGFSLVTTTWELGINPFAYGFRREVVENRPQDVLAFYRALNRAVEFLNTADREEFIDMIIDVVGYPPHTRDTLAIPAFPYFAPPQLHHVESVLQFSRDRGLLTAELTPQQAISTILAER